MEFDKTTIIFIVGLVAVLILVLINLKGNSLSKAVKQARHTKTAKPVIDPPKDTASTGTEAIVYAENGLPVKMRQYPSDSCKTWIKLTVGTRVEVVEPGEAWCKINGGGKKGWYMKAEFVDIVGDGKGKY